MILLDANVIILWLSGGFRLGVRGRRLLDDSGQELAVSLLTIFEIEHKVVASKLRLPTEISSFLDRFRIPTYSPRSYGLPYLLQVQLAHQDPFDRSLVGLAVLKGW